MPEQSDTSTEGEFDPYSLADEQRQQETAELRERNFRLELQHRLGKEVDEDVIYSARDALVRKGAEVTAEALATEYNRLKQKFTVVREQEPHRTTGTGGGSIPPGRRSGQPQPKVESLVQTIKKDQIRRGIYAY